MQITQNYIKRSKICIFIISNHFNHFLYSNIDSACVCVCVWQSMAFIPMKQLLRFRLSSVSIAKGWICRQLTWCERVYNFAFHVAQQCQQITAACSNNRWFFVLSLLWISWTANMCVVCLLLWIFFSFSFCLQSEIKITRHNMYRHTKETCTCFYECKKNIASYTVWYCMQVCI